MTDRRRYDPFAPHPKPQPEQGDDLDSLTKPQLIERAEARGLPIYGTKADLIERLRA